MKQVATVEGTTCICGSSALYCALPAPCCSSCYRLLAPPDAAVARHIHKEVKDIVYTIDIYVGGTFTDGLFGDGQQVGWGAGMPQILAPPAELLPVDVVGRAACRSCWKSCAGCVFSCASARPSAPCLARSRRATLSLIRLVLPADLLPPTTSRRPAHDVPGRPRCLRSRGRCDSGARG